MLIHLIKKLDNQPQVAQIKSGKAILLNLVV